MNQLMKCALIPKSVTLQQLRTTFILKRRWEPLLHKATKAPHKLRAKHFIYDLVEDTLLRRKENLEVVLTTYVEGIGNTGDIVALKPNFAYNNLLLPGLAVYKTDANVQKYAQSKPEKKEEEHSSPYAQRTVNVLQSIVLSVIMNKDEPWTLEKWHIRASLRKAGFYCNEDCITLPEKAITGPDLKLEMKDFYVIITINNFEKAKVKCRIHHWSTDPSGRLPYVEEHWKLPGEPLFV